MPGAKMPCVRWKEFQERRASYDELCDWYKRWPDAGVAIILGPISGLFAIDVDGEEAHKALMERLKVVPRTPKARSGSRKPFRYHLFFKYPNAPTNAKFTPWHPSLEFRGRGGIVVAPPSLHKSGHRYAWVKKRTFDDVELADVPEPVVKALKEKGRKALVPAVARPSKALLRVTVPTGLTIETQLFIRGEYADAVGVWNTKLFNAACDLAGNGIPKEVALEWLLAGAAPRSDDDREKAVATIESGYSCPRSPASLYRTLVPQQVKPIRLEPK